MLRPRIIPCLLVQNGGLVKTVQFGAPKYVGDPINAVKIFSEKEADELIILDIDATATGAAPNMSVIRHWAAESRMPLCYGGGVRTVEQAKQIVGLGVEKLAISAAAVENPRLIAAIAEEIGSQSVIVVLDVKKTPSGSYEVWTHNGTRNTGLDAVAMAKMAESLGAGELAINSIDKDGGMQGFDLDLARLIRSSVHLPLSILGGAGSLKDCEALIRACGVIGVSAGSLFVFKGPFRAVLINYPTPAQKDRIIESALGVQRSS
jgi:cyclase